MAYCTNDAEQVVAARRPNAGDAFDITRPDQNPVFAARDGMEARVREQANQADWVDAVSRANDPDTVPGQPANAEGRSNISAEARRQAALIDRAYGAENLRLNEFNDAMQRLSGATVSDASRWLKLTNVISKGLAWKGAQFNRWALTHFGVEGRNILNNPLVAAFNATDPTIQGQLQIYTNIKDNIARRYEPIARRLGWDTQDMLIAVGEYMNGQHAPERNALLLARWRGELAAERAKPAEKLDQKEITKLETQIDSLERNLEELVPIDAEGNPISLKSGGYTNAKGRKLMQDVLDHTGLTQAEAEAIAVDLRALNRQILQDRIDNGLVAPETVEAFPDFEFFVPYRTKFDNTTGVLNDSNIYNPGKFYEIDGTYVQPDSAFLSIMHHARRAANEIGMQRMGTELAAAHRTATLQGRDIGIQMLDYGNVMRAMRGDNPAMRRWAENLNNQGGMVVNAPFFDAEGNQSGFKRMLYTFDPNFKDSRSGLTGAELNAALSDTVKSVAGIAPLAKLTSKYGQMFTRWNPAFAPVNGLMRDPIERAMHMTGRDYYDASGNVVRGSSLVGSYFLNMPRAGKFLYDALRGRLDPESPGAQYWREYVENGLHQQYTPGMEHTRRTLADLVREGPAQPRSWTGSTLDKMPGVKQRLDQLGRTGESVTKVFDGWNDYFNNINIFNQYMTMREAGINPRNAAQGTLELLDLTKSGTLQPFLSTMFPFVKPTVNTGVAVARTLGLAPDAKGQFRPSLRGSLGVIAATAGVSAMLPLLKEGLGRDESGMYRFDQLGLSELQRFIPIGIGDEGDYIKLSTGFGLPQLAMTLAVGLDRVERGLMEPENLVFESLYAIGKNVTPGDFPEFSLRAQPKEWLTQLLTPTVLKPLFTDTDFMGRPITTAKSGGMKPMAEQGKMGTERVYHRFAQNAYQMTGIDMAPEQWKNWTRHLAVGPVRLIKGILEGGELPGIGAIFDENGLRTSGVEETAMQKMGPFFAALGSSLLYGRTHDTGRAMYYQALNEYRRRIREEGISVTSREYGSDTAKREEFQRKALQRAGWSAPDIQDFLILMRTEHNLGSNNTKFAQELRPIFLSSDDSTPIRAKFEELATRNSVIYNGVVPHLNYYARAR